MKQASMVLLASLLIFGCGGTEGEAPVVEVAAAEEESSPAATPVADLLPNAVTPEEGLLTGGQPSVEQLEALRDAGYVTIVNLRTEGEAGAGRTEVEELGMTYVTLPVAGAEGLTEQRARDFAAILEDVERPAVVHCGSGNRVGALFALKAYYVDGLDPEEALALGRESGMTRLEGDVREHLAEAAATSAEP